MGYPRSIGRTTDSGPLIVVQSPRSPANTHPDVPIVCFAQDSGLSRRQQRFKSAWGRQLNTKAVIFLCLVGKGDMRKQYTRSLFKATENIPHTPGSSLSPFLPSNGSAVKTSTCVATHPGRPAIRRPRPNIPLCLARYLGIRLMYAPPYRHVPHVPTRPLVIRSSLCFPGETLYRADMRRNLRRRIIMDIAQLLSGLAIIPPFSFLAGKLIVGKFIDAPLGP